MTAPTQNPNIFDYATSELSQDAFICYMLNFPDAAKLFLGKCHIYNEEIKDIKRQYKADIVDDNRIKYQGHIDILVETDNYYLIVEDKTGSGEHDDQIWRYVTSLKRQQNENKLIATKNICVCYIKTDYLSNQEQDDIKITMENKHANVPINFMCLGDLLDIAGVSNNPILKQWKNHFQNQWKLTQQFLKDPLTFKDTVKIQQEHSKIDWIQRDIIRIYLDKLSDKIYKWTKGHYPKCWFIAMHRTPHIELRISDRKEIVKDCWFSQSLYVMFCKKNIRFVIKQHIYNKEQNGDRIRIKNYSSSLKKALKEIQENIDIPKEWKSKCSDNEDKVGLLIAQKQIEEKNLLEELGKEDMNFNKLFNGI